MNIFDFNKGAAIVRVESAKPLYNGFRDISYMGQKLILVDIKNSQIYLRRTGKIDKLIFGNKLLHLPIDSYDDGWGVWEDPELLAESKQIANEDLEPQYKEAIKNRDYLLAAEIKQIMNKYK